jgi:hypothetical protein
MKEREEVVSFIDETLRNRGAGKWNARYGYGFDLGKRGSNLSGDAYWMPQAPATKDRTIKLYKLHGSLHFDAGGSKVKLKQRPYRKQFGQLKFTIIPPESNKRYDQGVFKRLWYQAGQALHRARTLVVIGYSFPLSDSHATALFRVSIKEGGLKTLVLVNPDRDNRVPFHNFLHAIKCGLINDRFCARRRTIAPCALFRQGTFDS